MTIAPRDSKICLFDRGVRFTGVRLTEVMLIGNKLRSAETSGSFRLKEVSIL